MCLFYVKLMIIIHFSKDFCVCFTQLMKLLRNLIDWKSRQSLDIIIFTQKILFFIIFVVYLRYKYTKNNGRNVLL